MSGFVIRHGTTEKNVQGVPRGLSDVSLTAEGIVQAHKAGKLLKPYNATSLRASLIRRSVEFATIIGKEINVKPLFTKTLDTLNIGELVKLPEDKAEKRIRGYMINSPDRKIPGGQSVNEWLHQIWPELTFFFVSVKYGRTPAIVTHGRLTLIIHALIAGNCQNFSRDVIEQWPIQQKPGEIFTVAYNGSGFTYEGPLKELVRTTSP
jgi:broad specificity phosphatase PhoE